MKTRNQILLYIVLLAIFDVVIPIPLTGMILIMVLYQKPRWFKEMVDEIYG